MLLCNINELNQLLGDTFLDNKITFENTVKK